MRNILTLLLLCVVMPITAQQSLKRLVEPEKEKIIYISEPCPDPIISKPRNIISVPKNIPLPKPFTLQDTAVYNINISLSQSQTQQDKVIPTIVYARPKIKGLGLIIGGSSCYIGSAVCFILGSTRSYDFDVLENTNIVHYKNRSVTNTVFMNNIADVIQRQENERKIWNYSGIGLAVIGTVLNTWGIIKADIVAIPNGVAIKF
jgi:hypothetical protein